MKAFVCFYLLCGLTPILSAQEPSSSPAPTPPAEPLMEKAPAFAQWTITSKNGVVEESRPPAAEPSTTPTPSPAEEDNAPAENNPPKQPETKVEAAPEQKPPTPATARTTTVTKTKSLRYEHIVEGSGESTERWCLPDIQITVQGAGPAIVSLPNKAANSSFIDYSAADFPDFDWISPNNFAGTKEVNDQECYVFRKRIKNGSKDHAAIEWVACINTATRLPVTLQLDEETRTYEFGLAPTAMVKLPPSVAAKVEEWKKSVQQSVLMPAKP